MSGTELIWDKLKDTADTFASRVKLKRLNPGDEESEGGSDFYIDIRGDLTCASASRKSTQDDKKYDYFLLTHNLGFTPDSGQEIAMYVVILRVLQDSTLPFSDFPAESDPIPNWWTGQDDFSSYRWGRSSQPDTLAHSNFLSTDPKPADNSNSYTTSSSISIGANAGFFADAPTGGIDVNWTMSHSQSVTITPTKIVNVSSNNVYQVLFIPQQQKSSTFQPVIQALLETEDDGQGTRNQKGADGRKLALELRIIILPKGQVKKRHHKTGTKTETHIDGDGAWTDYIDQFEDTLWQAYHEIARVIHIPLPPVPKA